MKTKHSFFLILLSAVSIFMSFVPLGIWPLFIAGLSIQFYLLDRWAISDIPLHQSALWGLFCGTLINAISCHWLIYTMVQFSQIPVILSCFVFILYAIASSIKWMCFFITASWYLRWRAQHIATLDKSNSIFFSKPLHLTALWGLTEYFSWQLFPYHASNLISTNLYIVQIADILGTYGASLIIFLITYFVYVMIRERRLSFLGIGLIIMVHMYGIGAIWYWDKQASTYPIKTISVMQSNTPLVPADKSSEKIQDYYEEAMYALQKSIKFSEAMLRRAYANPQDQSLDLILWPEGSIPHVSYRIFKPFDQALERIASYHHNSHMQRQRSLFQSLNNIPESSMKDKPNLEIMFNDLLYKNIGSLNEEAYSNVILFDVPGRRIKEEYQKIKLLPFAEYVPILSTLQHYYPDLIHISSFNAGKQYKLLQSDVGQAMPLVCYEVILPQFVLDFYRNTDRKAQIIINLANDAWFGQSIESREHLELARLRAIEFRIPLLRAMNSGISTYFDVTGRSNQETPIFTEAMPIYKVRVPPPDRRQTLYAFWGNYPLFIFYTAFLLLWCLYFLKTWLEERV